MSKLELLEPTTLEEAVDNLQADGARPLAGGTMLAHLISHRMYDFSTLVSLQYLPELRGIRVEDSQLSIGAMTPLREVAASEDVRALAPGLASAAGYVGNVRIRNMATLGGNLCYADPRCDPPAALLAHGAMLVLRGPAGERRVPLENYFLDFYETALQPGEILVRVEVPKPSAGSRAAYVRFTMTSGEDWPCVAVCAVARVENGSFHDLRLGLVGAANRPLMVEGLDAVVPQTAARDVAEHAAAQAEPIDDLRGSEWYKREMVRVHTRRALESLASASGGMA